MQVTKTKISVLKEQQEGLLITNAHLDEELKKAIAERKRIQTIAAKRDKERQRVIRNQKESIRLLSEAHDEVLAYIISDELLNSVGLPKYIGPVR